MNMAASSKRWTLCIVIATVARVPCLDAYAPLSVVQPVTMTAARSGLCWTPGGRRDLSEGESVVHGKECVKANRRAVLQTAGRASLAVLLGLGGVQGVSAKESELARRLESDKVTTEDKMCIISDI